jgi:epoxyqueuosine reductase
VLENRLKQQARELGFAIVGIAAASTADGFDRLTEWLDRGYAGEMDYLSKHPERRREPASILPGVRSVVMVGMNYSSARGIDAEVTLPGQVARYARGPDYHEVLWEKLDQLMIWLRREAPGCNGRGVVDSAPLLERDFARRAGLGWFGKNTMLINKREGSFFFIGALLVDIDLRPDPAHIASHCGACTACLDACPTDAFAGPGWLDARRCISYLTIELRSPIPDELRPGIGNWLFGCDICQDVCPWNSKPRTATFPVDDDLQTLDPVELLSLTEDEFRRRFRGTALLRTKRRGLLRNAAIVLGNVGGESALAALRRAAADPEPLVSEAASWAIERIVCRTNASEAGLPT